MNDARSDTEAVPPPLTPVDGFRSGFVALLGRPNVGKSTLLNRLLGTKVTITSNKPQTTRHQIRGVHHGDGVQIVFVDTPGIHKPRSALGHRLNETATSASRDVDVQCLLIDGRSGFGRGDRMLAERLDPVRTVIIVNKIDHMDAEAVLAQLTEVAPLDASAYFPVSARRGTGVPELMDHLRSRMPEGPPWYPTDMTTDTADEQWVAELVREQLLRVTRQELPHSIATRVTEWIGDRIRVEILVERESQKGIVIGKGGQVLKDVGTKARASLPKGTFLELVVTVDDGWQHNAEAVERLGY